MRGRSKRYTKDAQNNAKAALPLTEAVSKLKEWGSTRFDQTVECVICLGIDTKHADQAVRGAISLPHGIGKQLRVIAFCEGDDADQAKEAGALEVGSDELVKKIQDGWLDFDVAVAHPRMMSKVGKLGRVLGPQGKMPSPKSGTVTPEVAQAVKDYSAGKVEYRNDSGGNMHIPVGKLSFEPDKLVGNITAFVDQIRKQRPTAAKGLYIKAMYLSATMSPSVPVAVG